MAVAGAADTVFPRPPAITQLHKVFIPGHGSSACSNRLPSSKFVGDILSVSALIGLVTLTVDLLTWNLVRVIACKVGNLLNNFDVL